LTVSLKFQNSVHIQIPQHLLFIIPRGKALLEYSLSDNKYIARGLYAREFATQKPRFPDMGNSMVWSNTSNWNVL